MQFHELVDPKGIAKDVTNVGRWGNGDVEIGFSDLAQLPLHYGGLIRQAFEKQMESALGITRRIIPGSTGATGSISETSVYRQSPQ